MLIIAGGSYVKVEISAVHRGKLLTLNRPMGSPLGPDPTPARGIQEVKRAHGRPKGSPSVAQTRQTKTGE